MKPTRFWIEFDTEAPELHASPYWSSLRRGCGVSAFTLDDAMNILRERLLSDHIERAVARVVTDVDVSTLDPGHILPNLGLPTQRGIWFPTGI
jgi:hypothetical protein